MALTISVHGHRRRGGPARWGGPSHRDPQHARPEPRSPSEIGPIVRGLRSEGGGPEGMNQAARTKLAPVWIPILSIGMAVWAVSVAVVIILQRRSAAATLAWVLALLFLPIVGLIVYRLIGPMRLERKKLKRSNNRKVVKDA